MQYETYFYLGALLLIMGAVTVSTQYTIVPEPEYVSCVNVTDYDNCTDTETIDRENEHIRQIRNVKMWMLEFFIVMSVMWLTIAVSACYIRMQHKHCRQVFLCCIDETYIHSLDILYNRRSGSWCWLIEHNEYSRDLHGHSTRAGLDTEDVAFMN